MATADLTVIALGRAEASASASIAELSVLELDERRDREQTLADKVESVRRRLEG